MRGDYGKDAYEGGLSMGRSDVVREEGGVTGAGKGGS